MKKTTILILSFACALSAAFFVACNGTGNSGTGGASSTENCSHEFAENSYACEDRVCRICGVKVKASEGHTYVADSVVKPTCEENGYTLQKCACGATQKTDSVTKLGHDYGEYVETVVATCQTVGVKTATCSRCGGTDNTYTPALEHTFDNTQDIVKKPTCTENGFTRHVCLVCEEIILDTYVSPLGHTSDGVNDGTVAPTCETQGYDTHKCDVCKIDYTDNYVAALGHNWTTGEVREASCSSVGYKQEKCSVCETLRRSDMATQKTAHTFGADGICTECKKDVAKAFALSATMESGELVYIASDDAFGMTRYLLTNIGERENTSVVIGREVIDALIAKGYTGVTLRFYNPDELMRLYVWKVSGLHAEDQMANNFAPNGYSDTCVLYVPFCDETGALSAAIKENGIQITMFHTVASGQNCGVADSMGIEIEWQKPFDVEDKSTWCTQTDSKTATVEYVEGKGWKATATGAADYDFALNADLLAKQIENGATKLCLTFGNAFDGTDHGDGVPCNCKVWIIPKSTAGTDVWGYNVAWISGFTDNGDGTYSVVIDLTDKDYDFTKGISLHVSYKDVLETEIGACYLYDIAFS